ncbi:MAG: hypothetical protein AWU57_2903 [Marinobacter sp. T13-3]|jgi:hypothetical protein|nr:MAG: hypothetical protein AWU57_2903 [Marinobacter sp. T13-3]
MKIAIKLWALLCLVLVISGCGTVSVASSPDQKISRNAKITVVTPASDPQNIAGELEHLLLSQGFAVTSEAVGRSQIEFNESEEVTSNTRTSSGAVGSVTRLPTDLIMRFSYNAYFDVFYWSFTRFNGTIIDLETGAVIASVSFTGDRSVASVLEDFAQQIGRMVQ